MALTEAAIKAVSMPGARSVMLLGKTDAGKTTLAGKLARLLSKEVSSAILDLDMGQASLGPPSTISWGFIEDGLDRVKAQDIYFTGALSPPGNMLPGLTGAKLLMDKALSRCEKLIIDTTGLVAGEAARAYKQYKIDLLRPDVILALQEEDELEHIISPYALMGYPIIMRLAISPQARTRNMAERALYRAERLKTFFEGANVFEVDLKKCGLRRTKAFDEGGLEGRLVSFRDAKGTDLSIGTVVRASLEENRLLVRSPLALGAPYSCVIIGVASMPPIAETALRQE